MASTHAPFILQLSSKLDVGSNVALIDMGSPLCSVEHTTIAVQRKKLIPLHRGLNILKFFLVPIQSPAYPSSPPPPQAKPPQQCTPRGPKTSRGCKFQLQPRRAAAEVGELAGQLAKSWQAPVKPLHQFFWTFPELKLFQFKH